MATLLSHGFKRLKNETTFETLRSSGDFDSLDAKLASALGRIVSGEAGREVTRVTETEAREGRLIKGRQILFLLLQYYRVNEEAVSFYNLADLCSTRLVNDGQLEQFLNTWDNVLAGMDKEPDDAVKEKSLP